jgi:hypothetical protein
MCICRSYWRGKVEDPHSLSSLRWNDDRQIIAVGMQHFLKIRG